MVFRFDIAFRFDAWILNVFCHHLENKLFQVKSEESKPVRDS